MSDRAMEILLGNLLRLGVILAGLVVLLGGILELRHHGGDIVHYSVFQAEPWPLRSVGSVWQGVLEGRPYAFIQLGLLLLIFTPILRVALSVLLFARQRDGVFTLVTLFVLGILLYSLSH